MSDWNRYEASVKHRDGRWETVLVYGTTEQTAREKLALEYPAPDWDVKSFELQAVNPYGKI